MDPQLCFLGSLTRKTGRCGAVLILFFHIAYSNFLKLFRDTDMVSFFEVKN
jgi:hypothetical protein